MPKERRLNEKQLRFVEAYLDCMNITQAVLAAGYDMKPAAAAAHGSRLLNNAKIQEALREAREARQSKLTINNAWVLEQIAQIAQDTDQAARDRLKALELLGKSLGTFDRRDGQEDQGVKVTFEAEMEAWSE